jgi:Mg-chelatase subunit ChlD
MTDSLNTHVYFLLDRSGSMASIAPDVVGGFNRFIDEQLDGPNRCRLTLVQFDGSDPQEVLVDGADIDTDTPKLTADTYSPRGSTPLLDATALILDRAEKRAKRRKKNSKDPEAIMVVTFTDGQENASEKTSTKELKARIEKLTGKGWTFAYLGANQDSWAEASQLGYGMGSTRDWAATAAGTQRAYGASGQALTNVRTANSRGVSSVDSSVLFDEPDQVDNKVP